MTAQRTLVVAEFISLDGVVEAPETWHMSFVDEQLMGAIFADNARMDTMLLGRTTYESFAGAFADVPAGDPVAQMMNRPDRVVVSTTLRDPAWERTTVLSEDVEAGIRALKERPGKDILTTGSTKLVRTMLRAGLVDELHLFVHPVVVGSGERLFEDDGPRLNLELVHSETFGSGVTDVRYRVAA
jgi:dihydrofolate reductase